MPEQIRVMLVDDDQDTQNIFRVVMEHYEVDLEVFEDAESALKRLETKPIPDVIVVDIVLPGIDGYQMLGRSRSMALNCPLVATTAYHSQTTATEVMNWGFKGFLPKPLQPTTLVADLEKVISRN
jgi:two-component system, cell cycle response regulator DivK